MIERGKFFQDVRHTLFGGKLAQHQVDGLDAILDEWDIGKWGDDVRQLAYVLATAYHETDKTMQPIEEYGKGKGRRYGRHLKESGKPYTDTLNLFYGRGLCQLTWYENYFKFGKALEIDLIGHPEKALEMPIAVKILFLGMFKGWFTGKKLSDYINQKSCDFYHARKIVNVLDRAALISVYAEDFLSALKP